MPQTEAISCREFVSQSTELLEHNLDAHHRAALEGHQTNCPDCRRYMEQTDTLVDWSGKLVEKEELSSGREDELMGVTALTSPLGRSLHTPSGQEPRKSASQSPGSHCPLSVVGAQIYLDDLLGDDRQISVLEHLVCGCEECAQACVEQALPDLAQASRVRKPLGEPAPTAATLETYLRGLSILLTQGDERPESLLRGRGISPTPFLRWLICHGRQLLANDPRDCEAISRVAVTVSESLGAEERARAAMYRAHTLRFVLGDFYSADKWFGIAERILRFEVSQPLLHAKLLRLWGLARHAQSRNAEAFGYFQSAQDMYLSEGDLPRLGETYLEIARVLSELYGPKLAIKSIFRGSGLVDWGAYPRFVVVAGQNLADFYGMDERPVRGVAAIELSRSWLPRLGDVRLLELHLEWTEGRLFSAQGRHHDAVEVLSAARLGFVGLGQPGQAAFIGLDLCVALLTLGRSYEVRDLSRQILGYFSSRQISGEALAALRLFAEAAAREAATIAHVGVLAEQIGRTRGHGRR